MDKNALAKHIAREIFEIGGEQDGEKAYRIQFMHGNGTREFAGCGLSELSLERVISRALDAVDGEANP